MVLDKDPAHPQVLQDLHQDIKFVFLPPNTTSLLQLMDQGVIKMFKAHYLQTSWCSLSMKCDLSLDELENAAQAPEQAEVELQKDVVRRHWKSYTICNALWNVCDAWKEVTESCISGSWKKLCLELVVDFRGFDLSERLSEECLKCLELARRVGLDEIEENDVDSLLESVSEELSMEELDELEKQRRQFEEKVEAEQYPTAPLTMKILQCFSGIMNQGLNYLEEVDPDYEWAGLMKRRVMANLAHYEQLFYKRREATQATLNAFFRKASLPEASASDEPQTSDKPQPGAFTGGFTRPNVPSPSLTDVDNPGVV